MLIYSMVIWFKGYIAFVFRARFRYMHVKHFWCKHSMRSEWKIRRGSFHRSLFRSRITTIRFILFTFSKVGTLDQLVSLSDELQRVDQFTEQVTRKIANYLADVFEDQRDKFSENLKVKNCFDCSQILNQLECFNIVEWKTWFVRNTKYPKYLVITSIRVIKLDGHQENIALRSINIVL